MAEDDEKLEQDFEQENPELSKLLDLKNEIAQAYIDKIKEGGFSFSGLVIGKGDMLKDYLVSEDVFDKIADEAKGKFLFQPFIKPLLSETIEYNGKTITIGEYLEQAKKELDMANTEAELNNLKSKIEKKDNPEVNTNVQTTNQQEQTTDKQVQNSIQQQQNTNIDNNNIGGGIPYKEAAIISAGLVVGKDVVSAIPKDDGKTTSEYGVDRGDHKHGGIDYGANKGTPVYSMVEGTVDRVLYEDNGFGNYVVIKDKDGKEIIYAHLKEKPDLKPGQAIAMGEKIGKVGNTGKSTGPHLHLEVREDGKSVDPKTIFPDEVLLA